MLNKVNIIFHKQNKKCFYLYKRVSTSIAPSSAVYELQYLVIWLLYRIYVLLKMTTLLLKHDCVKERIICVINCIVSHSSRPFLMLYLGKQINRTTDRKQNEIFFKNLFLQPFPEVLIRS